MYFGQVGGRFLAKMIEKDLLVIEILMKRMAQFYRDLSQSSPSRRNRKCKVPETRSRKTFFDFVSWC